MGRTSFWAFSHDGVHGDYIMYRRHYSAKNKRPKIRQFVGPGDKMVLTGFFCNALFAWRKFIDDSGQQGVNCAVFRNESSHRSSDMILEAEKWAAIRWPGERLYTYVDPNKIRSTHPGYCFKMAGWKQCGETKNKLMIFAKSVVTKTDVVEAAILALARREGVK